MRDLPRNLTGTAYQTPYGEDKIEIPKKRTLHFCHEDLFGQQDDCDGGTFRKRDIRNSRYVEEFYQCDGCGMLMTEEELITAACETYYKWENFCVEYEPEENAESWDY